MVHVAKITSPVCAGPDCTVKETTPPQTPTVRTAAASAKLMPANANFQPNHTPVAQPAARDPAYIELGNWEPGTRFQILNRSNNPTATFADASEVVTLDPTGRDITNRIASVWMTQEEMDKINLDGGDSLFIRLINADGVPSEAVATRLRGNGYGEQGRVVDGGAWHAASRLSLLDGEAQWKSNMILRHVADVKAPEVKAFEAKLKLETAPDGTVTLQGGKLLEDGARVRVQSGASGSVFDGAVDANQALSMPLGVIKEGDTLYVTVTDINNVAAGQFEVRYGAKCKDGRAPTKGILGARLSGVIKPG